MLRKHRKLLVIVVSCMAISLAVFLLAHSSRRARSAAPTPDEIIRRSWELVKQSGAYHFEADVLQTELPLAVSQNVGRQSRQQSARLEGQADLPARQLEFTLWAQGGSVLDQSSGTQVRVDGDKAYTRQGRQTWREVDNFSGSFAPQGDFMSFLAGAKNIRPATVQGQLSVFTFDIDGPGFAAYLRDRLQAQLESQGKLPPGLTVGLSEQYARMTGQGEIQIGADGLPRRLAVQAAFPPGADNYQTQAEIVTIFSGFAPLSAAQAGLGAGFFEAFDASASRLGYALAFLGLLSVVLLAGLRRKPVYAALVVVVIAAMVFGPPLQQVKAGTFVKEQAARGAAQKERQQADQQAQQVNERLTQPRIQPNASPLEAANARQTVLAGTAGAQEQASTLSIYNLSAKTRQAPTVDPTLDSDHDGLPDVQENLLGTDPFQVDTDNDTLTDTVEVNGFVYNQKTWYGDPTRPDTNGDGLGDGEEWGKDTDQDGTPDLWSRDNDGDQVPDNLDLSPYQANIQVFDRSTPLSLVIDNLQPNVPTYVDFQVRPITATHLRYAFNVFKWPKGDVAGQMMDVDGKTFKDVYPTSDSPQDANGDVKLVPMLEIQITGSPTNLPSQDELKAYGVFVRSLTADSSQQAAYVPLQLTVDGGDNRVAFQGRMFYRPSTYWGNAQQVRLVWAVQALVDECKADGFKDGQCQTFDTYNQLQLLQVYPDAFTITGLNVREDHGASFAFIYQDPTVITGTPDTLTNFTTLGVLAGGLDHSFLAGRVGPDGQRDMTLPDIQNRFDHTLNAGVPISPTRFNISQNIFRVMLKNYEHIDQARYQIAVTDTKNLLAVYTPYWSAGQLFTPTLLMAHEEYFRPLNLDSLGLHNNVRWQGATLHLSLPGTPDPQQDLDAILSHTLVAMNWGPYQYQSKDGWTACPIDLFIDSLDQYYPSGSFDEAGDVDSGALVFMKMFYLNIYQGYAGVVKIGDKIFPEDYGINDEALSQGAELFEFSKDPWKLAVETFIEMELGYQAKVALSRITNYFSRLWAQCRGQVIDEADAELPEFKPWSRGMLIKCGIAILILIITLLPWVRDWMQHNIWGQLFSIAIGGVFFALDLMKTLELGQKFMEAGEDAEWSDFRASGESGMSGLVVLTVIMALIQVGYFIYAVVSQHIKAFSIEFDQMLADLIASIIVLIIYVAISEIPIFGPLIVAFLTLIDTILGAFGVKGISYWLGWLISKIIYGYDPMVEPDANGGATSMTLDNPALGLQVGNTLTWGFPLTTTATHRDPSNWAAHMYLGWYTTDRLLNTSVHYQLDLSKHDVGASEGDMHGRWAPPVYDHSKWGHSMYRTWVRDDLAKGGIALNQAGVNQATNLWMDMGYWFPGIECWTFVCYRRGIGGQNPQQLPTMYLDVFPATLDNFYAWNWAHNSSLPFPAPKDWDGDGLLAQSAGGNDPDDTRWDTDGDTLSDYYEVTTRAKTFAQGGGNFNPLLADSDGDGLRDDDELRQGSDPSSPDTDQDGLGDLFEFTGYQFTYTAGKTTLVRSSIKSADADHDGMDDRLEYNLHRQDPLQNPFNPNVWNPAALALAMAVGSGMGNYVAPGQSVVLTTTLSNNFASQATLVGMLTTTLPSFLNGTVPPLGFDLLPGQAVTQTSPLSVLSGIPSQSGLLTATACARAGLPLVYFPFDEPAGATTFTNATGGMYNAICSGSTCPAAGRPPAPGFSGHSVYFDGSQQQILTLLNSTSDLDFNGSQPFSLAAWVYPTDLTHPEKSIMFFFFGKHDIADGNSLRLAADPDVAQLLFQSPKQRSVYTSMTPVSGGNPLLGKWYHVAVVYDGNNALVYLNGVLTTSDTYSIPSGPNSVPFTLGGETRTSWFMTGSMDEFYLYDRAISAAEVAQLAQPPSSILAGPACDLQASKAFTVTVDADPPTSTLTSLQSGQYLNITTTLIVGGLASDPTSYVQQVDVSVDGSGWQPANGSAAWAYAWDTSQYGEGPHTLQSRATDAVGNVETPSAGVVPVIDRTPPDLSASLPALLRAQPDPWGNWTLPINGQVNDPPAGTAPGSGAASVDVLLIGDSGSLGGGWQPAVITATNWSLVYRFPPAMLDPTGPYTLTVRASDRAGNQTPEANYLQQPFGVDNTPPIAELDYTWPVTDTITSTLTLTGVVTDTGSVASGVDQLQIAFVPGDLADVVNAPVLTLHLDDPANTQVFADSSGYGNLGTCRGTACPTAGLPGKFDQAVSFNGSGAIQLDSLSGSLITNVFSAAAWFNTAAVSTQDNPLLGQWDYGAGSVFYLGLPGSQGLQFIIANADHSAQLAVLAPLDLDDGQWHLAQGTWDGQTARLYADGALVGSASSPGFTLAQDDTPLVVGSTAAPGSPGFNGLVDEVMLFPFAFSDQQAAALYQRGAVAWQNVSLDQPEAITSTWSFPLPAGLEGIYEIDLRGTDQLGNRNDKRSDWPAWRGEIDVLAPRVALTQTNMGWFVQDSCQSADFNLVLTGYTSPCPVNPRDKTYYSQLSEWYQRVYTNTPRLYQVLSNCQTDPADPPVGVYACDRYGRCSLAPALALRNEPEQALAGLLYSAVITPADRRVLLDHSPLNLAVGAQALAGLQAVTITLDNNWLYTFNFPDASLTRTITATTWTPIPGLPDGPHQLVSFAQDWAGQVQTLTFTTTVWLDTQAPGIDITPTVLTASHQLPYPGVNLTGVVSNAGTLDRVEVSIQGGSWQDASIEASRWRYPWALAALPDGEAYAVAARATDLAGRQAEAAQAVVVDLAGPAPVTVTLAYTASSGLLVPLAPGQVIRDVLDPKVALEWTESRDGSGLAGYYVGLVDAETLRASPLPPLDTLAFYPAGSLYRRDLAMQEGHAYYAVVAALDRAGNLGWNWFGPVVADMPATPDYAPLLPPAAPSPTAGSWELPASSSSSGSVYQDWKTSGCTAMGVNRVAVENTPSLFSQHKNQALYATWDEGGLRMNWQGADWDASGDLFIYLESAPNQGSGVAFDPYGANNTITLPLQANYVVWASRSDLAEVLRWNGTTWTHLAWLGQGQYRTTVDGNVNYTDFYLPFTLLNISDPANTPLQAVAYSLEKVADQPAPSMQAWAAMPPNNPLNSPQLGPAPHAAPNLTLLNVYRWEHLGAGICPNQGRYLDADLRASLSITPPGSVTETRLGGLYLAWPLPANTPFPTIGDGQVITYTLAITNQGQAVAPAVRLVLDTVGALALPSGELHDDPLGPDGYHQEILVGDLLARQSTAVVWTAIVNTGFIQAQYQSCLHLHPQDPTACQVYLLWNNQAQLTARLYTALHANTEVETLVSRHAVDIDPPVDVQILAAQNTTAAMHAVQLAAVRRPAADLQIPEQDLAVLPPFYVRPGVITLAGQAKDPAGLRLITLQVLNPEGEVIETGCQAVSQAGASWQCLADVSAAADGERWFVRAQAADVFGYPSEWSPWRVLLVDTRQPTLAIAPASDALIQNTILNASQWVITGTTQDDRQISQVELCFGQAVQAAPFSLYMPVVKSAASGGVGHRITGSQPPQAGARQALAQPAGTRCYRAGVTPAGSTAGEWFFALPQAGSVDGAYQTVTLFALDAAGNRSTTPLVRTLRLDTTPPQLKVDARDLAIVKPGYQQGGGPLLAGSAADGSGTLLLAIRTYLPGGGVVRSLVPVVGGSWRFDPQLPGPGTYMLVVEASDAAGNLAYQGPFKVEVVESGSLWLPLLKR